MSRADAVLKYWTWSEIQAFLLAHDLAIATGVALEDEVALTPRGLELFALLGLIRRLETEERDPA